MSNSKYFHFGREKIKVASKQDIYEKIYLRAIVDSYDSIDKSVSSENVIRDRIVFDLQRKNPITSNLYQNEILLIAPELYTFLEDESQKARSDIAFHWSDFGTFIVECKCLYQQPSRNKPYLHDGLSRFIELKYAKTNDFAAMAGFVVNGDIKTIFDTTCVETGSFNPSNPKRNIINPMNKKWKTSFISFHNRKDGRNIQIYHVLFRFSTV